MLAASHARPAFGALGTALRKPHAINVRSLFFGRRRPDAGLTQKRRQSLPGESRSRDRAYLRPVSEVFAALKRHRVAMAPTRVAHFKGSWTFAIGPHLDPRLLDDD